MAAKTAPKITSTKAPKAQAERTPKDEEAAQLAAKAQALAPDLKSTLRATTARKFIDKTLAGKPVSEVIDGIDAKKLRAFAVKGERDKDLRERLAALPGTNGGDWRNGG